MTPYKTRCPVCREESFATPRGRCGFCGAPVAHESGEPQQLPRTGPRTGPRAHAGIPHAMQLEVVEEGWALYKSGHSLRQVAAQLYERTGYASRASFAEALRVAWRRRGYKLRDRIHATADTHTKHGLRPRRQSPAQHLAYLELRRKRRAEGRKRCKATKNRPGKGRGERCERSALLGSDYCLAHDPAHRAGVLERLARMRELQRA